MYQARAETTQSFGSSLGQNHENDQKSNNVSVKAFVKVLRNNFHI